MFDQHYDYDAVSFDLDDADPDPIAQWWRWYRDAVETNAVEADAAVLSTLDGEGPDARFVLVRGVDERGFAFYSNERSSKGVQLATRPNAALTFGWLAAHRQVRVRGEVERVREIDADAYFASRPRGSQVGAWASPQSQVIANRAVLDDLVAAQEQRFANDPIPRPSFWGGWRVVPSVMEFWQGRSSRLHDRIRYRLEGQDWLRERLAP